MSDQVNQAILFLQDKRERLEFEILDLEARAVELKRALEVNAESQAEKWTALTDIGRLLDHISS